MKYIVYLTINLINKKEYIGVHGTENPEIFDRYLGCGCYSNKPSTWEQDSKSIFPLAVKKYGPENFKRTILFVYPYTEEGEIAAYKKEEELVNEEWIRNPNTYNITPGGKSGVTRDQLKKVRQYDLDGNYIKTWNSIKEANEVYKGHISAVCRRERLTAGEYQWRFDSENIDKLEKISLQRKTVYQYSLTGELLHIWISVAEAAKQFDNITSAKSSIKRVCRGQALQSKGYYWSYTNKFMYKTNYKEIPIACYSEEGLFIKSYTNIYEAMKELDITSPSGIYDCITGKHKYCKNRRWRFFYGDISNIKSL